MCSDQYYKENSLLSKKALNMHRVVLVDGNALAFRSLFSHEALTTKIKGKTIFTGMAFGFLKGLISIFEEKTFDKIVVFWDGGSYRKKTIYPDYKSNRKLNTKIKYKDIKNSLKTCRKLVKLIGIEQYRVKGEEADDLISSYAAQHKNEWDQFVIYSNDHDFLQLLSPKVRILQRRSGESRWWNKKKFIKEYEYKKVRLNIHPKFYPHFLAIVGDSTDNIPGIKGIGPVAAVDIFKQLDEPTLKEIRNELHNLTLTDTVRNKLKEGLKIAEMFFSLIQLKEDIELKPLEIPKQRPKKLLDLMMVLEFRSIYEHPKNMSKLCGLGE